MLEATPAPLTNRLQKETLNALPAARFSLASASAAASARSSSGTAARPSTSASDSSAVQALFDDRVKLQAEVDELYAEWAELEELVASVSGREAILRGGIGACVQLLQSSHEAVQRHALHVLLDAIEEVVHISFVRQAEAPAQAPQVPQISPGAPPRGASPRGSRARPRRAARGTRAGSCRASSWEPW